MKYRSKPVVIEAFQFKGTESLYEMVLVWKEPFLNSHWFTGAELSIGTNEGIVRASPGDWIIRGTIGEFYPCHDEVFRQKYEEVGE